MNPMLPESAGPVTAGAAQAVESTNKVPVSRRAPVPRGKRRRIHTLPPAEQLRLAEELEMRWADYIAEDRWIHKTDIIEAAVRKLQLEMRHVYSIGLLRGLPELPLRRPPARETARVVTAARRGA